jgi:hypothetical protein
VLVVHGIGTRRAGQALAKASAALIQSGSDWFAVSETPMAVGSVRLAESLQSEDRGPQVDLHMGDGERWIIRESWWGRLVDPPGYFSMLWWAWTAVYRSEVQVLRPLIRGVGGALGDARGVGDAALGELGDQLTGGIGKPRQSADPDLPLDGTLPVVSDRDALEVRMALQLAPPRVGFLEEAATLPLGDETRNAFLLLAIAMVSSLLLVASVVVFLLAAVVLLPTVAIATLLIWLAAPLPRVGKHARRVQDALAGSVGDAFVWQRRPLLREAIVTQVRADLQALSGECDAVVVIAHSQGASIAHEVLRRGGGAPTNLAALVTYGQGINRLRTHDVDLDLGESTSAPVAWFDYCADRDPVSVEPLPTSGPREGFGIRNLRSVTRDHSAYWDNDEEFVVPILEMLAGFAAPQGEGVRRATSPERAASGPPTSSVDDPRGAAVARRRVRVALLTAARTVALVAVLAVLVIVGTSWFEDAGGGIVDAVESGTDHAPLVDEVDAPAWVEGGHPAAVLGVIAVVLLAVGWVQLVTGIWSVLDRQERQRFLAHHPAAGATLAGASLTAAIAVIPLFVVGMAVGVGEQLRWASRENVVIAGAVVALFLAGLVWSHACPRSAPQVAKDEAARRARLDERVVRGLAQLDGLTPEQRTSLDKMFEADPHATLSSLTRIFFNG